jgi:hypothetical protein
MDDWHASRTAPWLIIASADQIVGVAADLAPGSIAPTWSSSQSSSRNGVQVLPILIAIMAQGEVVNEAPPKGYYQAPVLFRDVPANNRLWQADFFGPVQGATWRCAMAEAGTGSTRFNHQTGGTTT